MSNESQQQPTDRPEPGVSWVSTGVPVGPPHDHPARAGEGRRTSVLGTWGARIVLIVVAACALVSVVFILFGAGGDTLGRVVTTDVALIVFALLVWLDTVIGVRRPEWFEFVSLATDAYLLLLWIVTIWTENGSGPFTIWLDIWRSILCLIFVRGMLALVDFVRFLYGRWVSAVTRALAFVSAIALGVIAVMITIPAPAPFNTLWDHDFYGRTVASLAVVAGVALVLIPLWGLLTGRNRGLRHAGSGAAGAPVGSGYPVAQAGPGRPPATQPVPPVPLAPWLQSGAPSAAAAGPAGDSKPGAASPAPAPAGRPLAWPRLANGAPVPVAADGAPDFAAVAGAPLAWPTFVDGTPVPAAGDGSPLYR